MNLSMPRYGKSWEPIIIVYKCILAVLNVIAVAIAITLGNTKGVALAFISNSDLMPGTSVKSDAANADRNEF